QLGGQVVQPGAGGHSPGGAVGAAPLAVQATPTVACPGVGAHVLVEPPVAVGGGDPFGLAPRQEGADQGMVVGVLLEPPGAGVGKVEAGPAQQGLDVGGVAQIGPPAGWGVGQHGVVAFGAAAVLVGSARRTG